MSPTTSYEHMFRLPLARDAAFALFADPALLDLLTPSWFRIRPLDPLPDPLQRGTEIPYHLRWRGLPLRWTSVITDWREPEFLAYEQKQGPFRFFRHEHRFASVDRGTEVRDRVFFRAPGGSLADRLIALPDLRRIFVQREDRALALLKADHDAGAAPPGANRMPCTSASSSAIERPT